MEYNNENIKYTLKEYEEKFTNEEKIEEREIYECVKKEEEEINEKQMYMEQENYSAIFCILEEEYLNNYTRKGIDLIADYYGISKRKKKKKDLVQDIIIF